MIDFNDVPEHGEFIVYSVDNETCTVKSDTYRKKQDLRDITSEYYTVVTGVFPPSRSYWFVDSEGKEEEINMRWEDKTWVMDIQLGLREMNGFQRCKKCDSNPYIRPTKNKYGGWMFQLFCGCSNYPVKVKGSVADLRRSWNTKRFMNAWDKRENVMLSYDEVLRLCKRLKEYFPFDKVELFPHTIFKGKEYCVAMDMDGDVKAVCNELYNCGAYTDDGLPMDAKMKYIQDNPESFKWFFTDLSDLEDLINNTRLEFLQLCDDLRKYVGKSYKLY